ncbi:DNA cytosine methyltransferase [Slackia exigua]|uniref:DNA cytosine methyltransferase n=1 Tax=Slackia exigua TaxID=84109 RepID=UPI0023F15EB3|nr:DNA cytosine methyltransferase [Slackia exigua]
MRYASVFSGIEAASVAWEGLGWEPEAFAEVDAFPSAVLAERFPEVPNLGDVTQVKWKRFRDKVDLVVGGSPCQSFSIAGKREGLDGASGLMWEFVRCVREIRPRWLLWENVPGALSSSHGEDFRCLLEALEKLGYGLAWRVLDSQFFGVPQRRRRVFLVGHSGGVPRPEVLFERESLRWDFASSKDKRKELAARAGRSAKAAGFCNAAIKAESIGFVPAQVESQNDRTVGALCARDFKGVGNEYVSEGKLVVDRPSCMIRRLTPTECERLQGFPDGWTKVPYRGKPADECPDGARYKALGNSMAVPVMRWIGKRIALAESGSCNGPCNGVSDASQETANHQA